MNLFLSLMIVQIWVQNCTGNLLPCTKISQKVCSKTEDYVSVISPDPLPTNINLTLKIFEVMGVDEAEQTMTLSMMAIVEWQDYRLDVNRSKDYIER